MTVRLADLFDGETRALEPGEDFAWPCVKVVESFEEIDTDEELGPYESAPLLPVFGPDWPPNLAAGFKDPAQRDKQLIAQGWASLSVAMGTLIKIMGGKRSQYQWPKYNGEADVFTFQFEALDEGWEGGPL